ncbi:MAG TPA: hypothetical protein VMT34_00435 [Aggregatilineales bacterium]|nr:hypothetical protein [Aggregatilineales bacterium]
MVEILVDMNDPTSMSTLFDTFAIEGTPYEAQVRTVLSLIGRPFLLQIVHDLRLSLSPLQDQFSFDMDTDALIVFTDTPATLVDALLEMAMFLRGFNTLIGLDEEWKVNIAIGGWRHMRQNLRAMYNLEPSEGKEWTAPLDSHVAEDYDLVSFNTIVFLACHPNVEVIFPPEANPSLVAAYDEIARLVESVPADLTLDDHALFNRRLSDAVLRIEESIMPPARPSAPPDDSGI